MLMDSTSDPCPYTIAAVPWALSVTGGWIISCPEEGLRQVAEMHDDQVKHFLVKRFSRFTEGVGGWGGGGDAGEPTGISFLANNL